MCFNAEASFIGAAVIAPAGIAALAMVRDKREIPFAALPLLFAGHQALEGWTWLELDGATNAELSGWGVHLWVLYAWALLPIYVPWSVWLVEPDERRRRWMVPLVAVGGLLAAFMAVQAVQPEVQVTVVGQNLDYHLGLPFSALWLGVPYVLATCLTPILSSFRWIMGFGVANFVAMSAAAIIQSKDYSSMWCTFAAFLSLMIVGHFGYQTWLRRRGDVGPEVGPPGVSPAATG